MDFLDLKIFKQLYLQRSITAVSKSLYLSQPSVSYRLKKIQEDLGVELYVFDGTYHFNENSETFFKFCVTSLDDYDRMMGQISEDRQYTVSLSTIATAIYQSKVFNACLQIGIFPNIRTCTSNDAIVDVLDGRSRFAIVGGFNKEISGDLHTVDLRSEKIVFVYNKNCDGDLRNTPIVLDQKNSGIRKAIDEYISNFEQVTVVGEVGTTAYRLNLINENEIGMFIQEKYLDEVGQLENLQISKQFYFIHHISLIMKKTEKESRVTARLIEILNTTS